MHSDMFSTVNKNEIYGFEPRHRKAKSTSSLCLLEKVGVLKSLTVNGQMLVGVFKSSSRSFIEFGGLNFMHICLG